MCGGAGAEPDAPDAGNQVDLVPATAVRRNASARAITDQRPGRENSVSDLCNLLASALSGDGPVRAAAMPVSDPR